MQEDQNAVVCYTDGSCLGNPGSGGWAALIGNEMLSGSSDWATNNEMEVFAVLMAVMNVEPFSNVIIRTDSQLTIGWLSLGWKCDSNPNIIPIIEAYRTVVSEAQLIVKFEKVKGHSGDFCNERVDREAKKQAKLVA